MTRFATWLAFAFALQLAACKGCNSMKQFPADVDLALLSPTADPEDFPPHPGTISYYRGSTLVETEPASSVPDGEKFYYMRDSSGRIVSRIPIVKTVARFFRQDGSEAAEGEPSDASIIVMYDAQGREVSTVHSIGAYH